MLKNRLLVLSAAGLFLSSCTGVMTKNQAALVGAATCGTIGGLGGAATRYNQGQQREDDCGLSRNRRSYRRFALRRACVVLTEDPKPTTTTTTTATTAAATATTAGTETATATATTTAAATTGSEGRADDYPR